MIGEWLLAAALLIGGVLGLLGGLGLVRFPDVLARLHAATKAASLGLVLLLIAAAVGAQTTRGTFEAGLIVVFLFISAPLGSALLARAVHEDPDTELDLVKDVDATGLGREWTVPAPGGKRGVAVLTAWLLAVWVGLYGRVDPAVLVGGLLASGWVVWVLPVFRPGRPRGRFRLGATLRLVARIVVDTIVSTGSVALAVVTGRTAPAVIAVPLLVRTRVEAALVMNAISFTPGSVAFDMTSDQLLIHILDVRHERKVRDGAISLQHLVIRAFGTPEERRMVDG